jgi:hypothetical protein
LERCRLATADRGFARFDGLDWFIPARTFRHAGKASLRSESLVVDDEQERTMTPHRSR